MEKGFPLNYKNQHEINTTPEMTDEEQAEWAPIAAGISNIEPNFEDESDDTAYYDGEGFGSEDVTGVKASVTYSGHRKYGDAAQDFVASLALEVGEKRKTQLRWTQPDGRTIVGPVTISGIKGTGGDANAKGDFEFTATFNGKPVVTPPAPPAG